MRFNGFFLFALVLVFPAKVFACHPVLKCVQSNGNSYVAYFGFEGGESNLPIGNNNKFSGGIGCTSSGRNCGQGTHFNNNGPNEADFFGSDSIFAGQSLLPVNFSTSVSWTLSGQTVTATANSKACATPTPTRTATRTATATATYTATWSPTFTYTATATWTATRTATSTSTRTATPTQTRSSTPTSQHTNTPNPTNTQTVAPSSTSTPNPTATTAMSTPPSTPTPVLNLGTPTPEVDILIKDCAGVPGGTAEIDCCGVCGGDGTSCPELCQEINNRPAKKKLKREVNSITSSILKRIKQELRCSSKSLEAKKRKVEMQYLKSQIKTLLASYEDVTKLCDTTYCKKTSYLEVSEELSSSVKKLVSLDKLSQRGALKACCSRGGSCGGSGVAGPKRGQAMNEVIEQLPAARCD